MEKMGKIEELVVCELQKFLEKENVSFLPLRQDGQLTLVHKSHNTERLIPTPLFCRHKTIGLKYNYRIDADLLTVETGFFG